MVHANSITREILEVIKENPGCVLGDIMEALSPYANRRSVSNMMGRLQQNGAIENRGGHSFKARWYAVESKVQTYYLDIASDLLAEMKDIHHTVREEYLAERLEELFGDN